MLFQKHCRIASATSSLALLQRSAAAARARQREFSRASTNTKRWPNMAQIWQNDAKSIHMVQNACASSGSGHEGRFNAFLLGTLGISWHFYDCIGLQSNHALRHSCAFSLSLGSTSVDRENAQVHVRARMANVLTHTLVSFRSYLSEPCPGQTHLYDIGVGDFYRKDFLAESFQKIQFGILTFWLGLSAIPVVCKGMLLHHVAQSCTSMESSLCLQIILAGLPKESSRDARAFERLWERSLACDSANDLH